MRILFQDKPVQDCLQNAYIRKQKIISESRKLHVKQPLTLNRRQTKSHHSTRNWVRDSKPVPVIPLIYQLDLGSTCC